MAGGKPGSIKLGLPVEEAAAVFADDEVYVAFGVEDGLVGEGHVAAAALVAVFDRDDGDVALAGEDAAVTGEVGRGGVGLEGFDFRFEFGFLAFEKAFAFGEVGPAGLGGGFEFLHFGALGGDFLEGGLIGFHADELLVLEEGDFRFGAFDLVAEGLVFLVLFRLKLLDAVLGDFVAERAGLVFEVLALAFDLAGLEFEVLVVPALGGEAVGDGFFLGRDVFEFQDDPAEADVPVLEDEEGVEGGRHGRSLGSVGTGCEWIFRRLNRMGNEVGLGDEPAEIHRGGMGCPASRAPGNCPQDRICPASARHGPVQQIWGPKKAFEKRVWGIRASRPCSGAAGVGCPALFHRKGGWVGYFRRIVRTPDFEGSSINLNGILQRPSLLSSLAIRGGFLT